MYLTYKSKSINEELVGKVVNAIPFNRKVETSFNNYEVKWVNCVGDVRLENVEEKAYTTIPGGMLKGRKYFIEDAYTKELLNPFKIVEKQTEEFVKNDIIRIDLEANNDVIIGRISSISYVDESFKLRRFYDGETDRIGDSKRINAIFSEREITLKELEDKHAMVRVMK